MKLRAEIHTDEKGNSVFCLFDQDNNLLKEYPVYENNKFVLFDNPDITKINFTKDGR
jgi:hypothetical protein